MPTYNILIISSLHIIYLVVVLLLLTISNIASNSIGEYIKNKKIA